MEPSDALHSFRRSYYECLHRRADALFELTDALLTADGVPSPVHLSLQASHRRGWGSLYAALDRGRIDAQALRRLLARHPLAGSETPVYAVDASVWSRCDAECSPLLKASTTTRQGTRRGSPSSPDGPTSSSPRSASSARAGLPPCGGGTRPPRAGRQRGCRRAGESVSAPVARGGRGHSPVRLRRLLYDPVKVQRGL